MGGKKDNLSFPLFQAGLQLDQLLQIATIMQKHTHPTLVPLIPTWLDVQKRLRDFDQNHLLPNLSLIGEVELPGVEEEAELLLAVDEKGIDRTSEAKEVVLEGAVEEHTEAAFHLGNFLRRWFVNAPIPSSL